MSRRWALAVVALGAWVAGPSVFAADAHETGTTVVGDGESPLGLDLTPWRHAQRDHELDRAPLLLDVHVDPVAAGDLRTQMRDYTAVHAAHRVDSE